MTLIMVGLLTSILPQLTKSQSSSAAASGEARQLTRGVEVEDLQADLLLLQEDTLDTELSALRQLQ